jgi:hypothetical protein
MAIKRANERGGARLKFLIFAVIVAALGIAGYTYIPVAYQAYMYKDLMQHYVDVAAAQGYQPTWVSDQLTKSEAEYDVPKTAVITPAQRDGRIEARVQFTRDIEFPGYTYQYEFDHTARSTPFISIK